MYKEPDYAESRIRSTIVRLGDKPVFVKRVRGDMTCDVMENVNEEETIRVNLDDLNVLSPPLGFVNYRGRAVYISRKPMRRDYRQGLRTGQVTALVGGLHGVDWSLLMKCVKGDFPTLAKAVRSLEVGDAKTVAVSRDLLLKRNKAGVVIVHYRWKGGVGKVVDGGIVFDQRNEHLTHLLKVVV